ncbi:unnamed protein product [Clonostachys rhizophaga]|uniref:FAD-binding domain-containing protein n=1 Tax=Clonostachys rhizophaga TaxID=160324 RepID=A0A9N9VKZ0_9HYPO|nr:unnamed protein product [Clonostachys rhizophaga]
MSTPFKVAIVGGGMTGLIAALTLDRVGIDFFLVEAYPDVNPDVGASIALYPNYQRVLDQLGVLDHVLAESEELRTLTCRDGNGRPVFTHHVAEAIHAQTGYGIATFKRSQLLRILHENLSAEGKAKVHGSQRVTRIEELPGDEEGVRLHFEGGQTRDADIVIGADGSHSIVRSEMWRLAQQTDPKAFIGDQREDMVTEFGAVFGLSHNTGDLRTDYAYQISSQDMTIGLFGGQNGEALWFLFFKVTDENSPGRKSAAEIPTWTKEQGAEICRKYFDVKLSDGTTFGEVYNNAYRITTHACPMHTLRRWTAGRLICLGDSVARANPILAQGGAQGAESVLMLVDRLKAELQNKKKQQHKQTSSESDSDDEVPNYNVKLSNTEVEKLLTGVAEEREPRVRSFIADSQKIMRISAWSGWLFRLVGKYIAPWLPTWVIVAQALGPWKGAYLSSSLPAPSKKPAGSA